MVMNCSVEYCWGFGGHLGASLRVKQQSFLYICMPLRLRHACACMRSDTFTAKNNCMVAGIVVAVQAKVRTLYRDLFSGGETFNLSMKSRSMRSTATESFAMKADQAAAAAC